MMKYSPLGHFSSVGGGLERLGFLDVPVVAVDPVHGRKAVAMPIELAMKVRRSMPSFFDFSSAMAPIRASTCFCSCVLRPGDELLVGDHLGRDRRIDALVEVTLPLGNPHVADSLGFEAVYAMMSVTTFPLTSVSRMSRPA